MINFHQLEIFVAVVECGGFTKAAQQLFLTQPALSAQMRRLQATVGVPLLARDGRKSVPTEAGTTFYRYAREVLDITAAMRRNLDELASGELEHIVVGGNRTHGTYLLPRLLAQFHLKHPTIRLSFIDGGSGEIAERVRTDQIDVALVASPPPVDELVVEELGEDELVVVESAHRPVSRTGTMTAEQLARAPFVRTLVGSGSLGSSLERFLGDRGFGPRNVMLEMTTWEGVKDAVRVGVGLVLAFRTSVQEELRSGEMRVVHVDGYSDVHSLYLICSPHRKASPLSPVMQSLVDFMKSELVDVLHPQVMTRG